MAFLIGTEKATVEMPTKVVFEDVSLGVNEGDRVGVVGLNGDGKTTLLRLLSGALQPDGGRVIVTGGTRVGVLRQTDCLDDEATVMDAVVGDIPEHVWASDPKVRSVLAGLIGDISQTAKVGSLSGGQRRRVDLARVLIGDWDVLMLDEPTNHLDMRTITWLAGYLNGKWRKGVGALLVVSHDRWFLDETCNRMWEVHDGRVDQFDGGFSAYVMQRVERQRIAEATERKRQNRLRRELAWLSRGARARSTKPKFHVAAAKELIADVPELRNAPELRRMATARIGKDVVDVRDASVDFGNGPVLDRVDWTLGPADRVGIVGANGAGKTTLLGLIRGEIRPSSGRVRIGATVKFAMLSQRLSGLEEVADSRVREVAGRYPRRKMANGHEMTASQLLEDLGFRPGELNEFVRDLSGGQKRRLALMMVLLEEVNVLILDEPGNDLDIDMLAALEDLLDDWPGTLVLVTHDRNLMERVTDNQYAIVGGRLRHLPGGVDEYLRIVESMDAAAGGAGAGASMAVGAGTGAGAAVAGNAPVGGGAQGGAFQQGESRKGGAATLTACAQEQPKLSNSERQRLKKLVASCEKKMATAEQRIAQAQAALCEIDPTDFAALMEQQAEVDALKQRLEELELEWLDASEALGED